MSIEAMKQALEALEIVNREMLTLRDELAERGGRPTQGYHQLLWDSSHKVYMNTAIPTAERLRQAIEQAERQSTHSEDCYKWHHACAIARIEQAQKREPVAWASIFPNGNIGVVTWSKTTAEEWAVAGHTIKDLYTFPPPRQPLTDEEMYLAIRPLFKTDALATAALRISKDEYRAIEAKLKEKNT